MKKYKLITLLLLLFKYEYGNSFLLNNNNLLLLNNNLFLKKKSNKIYSNLELDDNNNNINNNNINNNNFNNNSKYTKIDYSNNYNTTYKKQSFFFKNIINSGNNNEIHNIRMLNGDVLDNNILLLGELNEKSCFELIRLLNNKESELLNKDIPKEEKYINLFIQSQGGSLLSTLAVVDEIKKLDIPLYTYVKGYAASSATLLSILGTRRFISENSLMMIHGPKLLENDTEMTLLKIKDINQNINLLTNIIKKIYLENTKISEQLLNELLYHNVWMSSNDALKHGLVDEIN